MAAVQSWIKNFNSSSIKKQIIKSFSYIRAPKGLFQNEMEVFQTIPMKIWKFHGFVTFYLIVHIFDTSEYKIYTSSIVR